MDYMFPQLFFSLVKKSDFNTTSKFMNSCTYLEDDILKLYLETEKMFFKAPHLSGNEEC